MYFYYTFLLFYLIVYIVNEKLLLYVKCLSKNIRNISLFFVQTKHLKIFFVPFFSELQTNSVK
jgi:hypothetical protein